MQKNQTLPGKKNSTPSSKNRPKFTSFRARIRSRHPTHDALRNAMPLMKFKSIIRLGSTRDLKDTPDKGGKRVEVNTIQAIKNSANKLLMKTCFQAANIITALWWTVGNFMGLTEEQKNEQWPVVAKSLHGSRGKGNTLIKNMEEWIAWAEGKNLNNYIVEKYYDYNREYRLHVTKNGCFYTNRKMLKGDTPEDKRWFRNDSNSSWMLETNPLFDKPSNWVAIIAECVKALNAVGLDIGACDVKVQSAKNADGKVRKDPKFIVIETNSAPSFGEGTTQRYLEELPKILVAKHSTLTV
jgi:hypothetical protein